MNEGRPRIVAAAGGEALWFLGTLAIIRIDADDTGGRFSLTENVLPKDSAPPLHSHPQSETFYILEGEMTIWIDGRPSKCAAGSTAHAPAGVPHTFLVTSETMRVLTLSAPAGIERFFKALGVPAKERRIPDDDLYPSTEEIEAAAIACSVTVHGPPPAP